MKRQSKVGNGKRLLLWVIVAAVSLTSCSSTHIAKITAVVNEAGRPLSSIFADLPANPKLLRQLTSQRQPARAKCRTDSPGALKWISDHIFGTVHAQSCSMDACGGYFYIDNYVDCNAECDSGEYDYPIASPFGVNQGYYYTGATVCDSCNQCEQDTCYND